MQHTDGNRISENKLPFQDQYKEHQKKRSRNANSESEADSTTSTTPLLPKPEAPSTSPFNKKRKRPKSGGSLRTCTTDDHELYTLGKYLLEI